jgi:hypothetical protein
MTERRFDASAVLESFQHELAHGLKSRDARPAHPLFVLPVFERTARRAVHAFVMAEKTTAAAGAFAPVRRLVSILFARAQATVMLLSR